MQFSVSIYLFGYFRQDKGFQTYNLRSQKFTCFCNYVSRKEKKKGIYGTHIIFYSVCVSKLTGVCQYANERNSRVETFSTLGIESESEGSKK